MSEYWVSKKKYFCKYCETYIADDAPSRQHHESGMRHKGNKERFVRSLYKQGEKRKKDLEEEKREMERVDRAAMAAYAQDVAGGRAKASSSIVASSSSSGASSSKKPEKSSNPYANYSTAESLGYTDPDADRLKAEEEARRSTGTVGAWEIVGDSGEASTSTSTVQAQSDHPEDTRTHKLKKKKMTVGLGEIYDPGVIKIKPRVKQEEQDKAKKEEETEMIPKKEEETEVGITKTEEDNKSEGEGLKGKWKAVPWGAVTSSGPAPPAKTTPMTQFAPQSPEDDSKEGAGAGALVKEGEVVKGDVGGTLNGQETKREEAAEETNGLFRKRKRAKLA